MPFRPRLLQHILSPTQRRREGARARARVYLCMVQGMPDSMSWSLVYRMGMLLTVYTQIYAHVYTVIFARMSTHMSTLTSTHIYTRARTHDHTHACTISIPMSRHTYLLWGPG